MTTFNDGPAKDVTLLLRDSPVLLRVVQDRRTKKWNALDQPDDAPNPGEDVFLYRLLQRGGTIHVRHETRGGIYPVAVYRYLEPQPAQVELRFNWIELEWRLR